MKSRFYFVYRADVDSFLDPSSFRSAYDPSRGSTSPFSDFSGSSAFTSSTSFFYDLKALGSLAICLFMASTF
jgi:hypothetical protein